MKLRFNGLSRIIKLKAGRPSFVCIENHHLYTRFVCSLLSGEGESADEPYTMWDDADAKLSAKDNFLAVTDPFNLPYDHRLLLGEVLKSVTNSLTCHTTVSTTLNAALLQFYQTVSLELYQYNGNYVLTPEVDIQKLLKLMGFSVDMVSDESYIDGLLNFVHIARDACLAKPLLFVGICSFLTEQEVKLFLRELKNSNLRVLFFENRMPYDCVRNEEHILLDLDFLES